MPKKFLFVEVSPLGYRVRLARNRWRQIVRYKHPALAGRLIDVRACVRDPDLIRSSAKDPDVHLHYRAAGRGYVCTVVGGPMTDRFVITAYLTQNIKKGQELWTK